MNRPFGVTIIVPVLVLFFALCLALLSVGCSEKGAAGLEPNDGAGHARSPLNTAIAQAVVSTEGLSEQMVSKEMASKEKATYTKIDWTDLLPDEDLEALENPPEYLAEIEDGSESDQLTSPLKAESVSMASTVNAQDDRYQQALISEKIRPEFNGRHIRIPGFIVPLEFDDHETITTFFLVPFFWGLHPHATTTA